MTKAEQKALDLIKATGASSVWVSRAAGRCWFAGEVKLSDTVVDKLAAAGLVRFIRNDAGVAVGIEVV